MKTTTENNKLIAEFMGVKTMTIDELKSTLKSNQENGLIQTPQKEVEDDLKYHTSWDWLMPVVEKINNILTDEDDFAYEFAIHPSGCRVIDNDSKSLKYTDVLISNEHGATMIEVAYLTVVDFIQWYTTGNICKNCGYNMGEGYVNCGASEDGVCPECGNDDKYPFKEGDDYYTIDGKDVIWSCWDDISEELYDENPHQTYYKTKEDAFKVLKSNGNSLIRLFDINKPTGVEINLKTTT